VNQTIGALATPAFCIVSRSSLLGAKDRVTS
jgi:hypothetical protein